MSKVRNDLVERFVEIIREMHDEKTSLTDIEIAFMEAKRTVLREMMRESTSFMFP